MNKGKKPLTQRLKKKVNKEVHQAQLLKEPLSKLSSSPKDSIKELLQTLPKKKATKEKSLLNSLKKEIKVKKAKKLHKTSKRTTPGLPLSDFSIPQNVHVEGKRWIKTLQNQSLVKGKRFDKKISKQKPSLVKRGRSK